MSQPQRLSRPANAACAAESDLYHTIPYPIIPRNYGSPTSTGACPTVTRDGLAVGDRDTTRIGRGRPCHDTDWLWETVTRHGLAVRDVARHRLAVGDRDTTRVGRERPWHDTDWPWEPVARIGCGSKYSWATPLTHFSGTGAGWQKPPKIFTVLIHTPYLIGRRTPKTAPTIYFITLHSTKCASKTERLLLLRSHFLASALVRSCRV